MVYPGKVQASLATDWQQAPDKAPVALFAFTTGAYWSPSRWFVSLNTRQTVLELQHGSLFSRHNAPCAKLFQRCAVVNRKRSAGRLVREKMPFLSNRAESRYKQSFLQRIPPAQRETLWRIKPNLKEDAITWWLAFSETNSNQHIELLFPPFFFPNQIYEKHNHNMRALLFYYQWVLLLENHFKWYVTWEQISFTNH